MRTISLHYRVDDGGLQEIVSVGDETPSSVTHAFVPEVPDIFGTITVTEWRWDGSRPVRLTSADRVKKKLYDEARSAPSMDDLKAFAAQELARTDHTQLPDFKVRGKPLTATERKAWEAWREAMRAVSRFATVEGAMESIKSRPDGSVPEFIARASAGILALNKLTRISKNGEAL